MSLPPLVPLLEPFLTNYLPRNDFHVTLTWAQLLDARIAAKPGIQTKISHMETKTMTHYLRSHHDAILVGVGTVLADDPKLNCRYSSHQIRPVVVDPHQKWNYAASTLCQLVEKGEGLAPYILVSSDIEVKELAAGERYLKFEPGLESWHLIFHALQVEGVRSVMVEGGAHVIGGLLATDLVDTVVITIGPVFLGNDGVEVTSAGPEALDDVSWWTGTLDVVMAGKLRK